jgi:hypothetical protein
MKKVIGLFALTVLMNVGIADAKEDNLYREYRDKTVYLEGSREPDAIRRPEYVTQQEEYREQRLALQDLRNKE